MHGFSGRLLDGSLSIDAVLADMRKGALSKFVDRIETYTELGYPAFKDASDYSITSGSYSIFNGKMYKPEIIGYTLEEKGRTRGYF